MQDDTTPQNETTTHHGETPTPPTPPASAGPPEGTGAPASACTGPRSSDDGYSPEDVDRLTARGALLNEEDLSLEQRLDLLKTLAPEEWFAENRLLFLAVLREQQSHQWYAIKAAARARGVNIYDLEKAMDDMWARSFPTPPDAEQPGADQDSHDKAPGAPWRQAMTAQDFLLQQERDVAAHVKDLILPGCITLLAAPRSSGKTIVTLYLGVALALGGTFRRERLLQLRVLVVDRDNPPSLIRKRLRCLGAHDVTRLKVLTRDQAPPLTDKAAWAAFPFQDYDVIIVDSVGAATEGVSEKEGAETQRFLATLKDLARRGPALLCLDNTNKAGLNYRGRGEKGDAVDILYECRNATGWTPSQADFWWESLPDFGEHAWKEAATRHKGQAVIRLAFIPTKFRMGIEPEPFVLEVDTRQEPWTLADVTETLLTAGAQAAEEARRQERARITDAEASLVRAIAARQADTPMVKAEAEALLCDCGLTRKQARTLLASGGNRDLYPQGRWVLRHVLGYKSGKTIGVYLAGTEKDGERFSTPQSPRQYTPSENPSSAVGQPHSGERLVSSTSSDNAAIKLGHLSPPTRYYTAEDAIHEEKQSSGHQESSESFAALTHSSEHFVPTVPNSTTHFVPTVSPPPLGCRYCGYDDLMQLDQGVKCPWCGRTDGTDGTIN